MSEDFTNNHNAKFSNVINSIEYFQQINNLSQNGGNLHSFNNLFQTKNENEINEINVFKEKLKCQSAESEVRFLKEWLLLHLDLIQQQNEEILSKERTILILQQENEMLRDRINCMEQVKKLEVHDQLLTNIKDNEVKNEKVENSMTQDLGPANDNKGTDIQIGENCTNVDITLLNSNEADYNNHTNISEDIERPSDFQQVEQNQKPNSDSDEIDFKVKTESETVDSFDSGVVYNFSSEIDSMKNLRMSIRRKRVCSSSSALSQNGSAVEEKRTFRRIRKRRKRPLKDSQILMTPDLYINQIGDPIPGVSKSPEVVSEVSNKKVLEVPRWRVKVYASCYSMEGTENLDDDVFLRRHNRLEIDERRRKRWDVQRIREQRVIEKLKQRQEKIDSHLKNDNSNLMSTSFWPSLDDIKIIEVTEELPIFAFGVPIPKCIPSDFTLPWLNDQSVGLKKERVTMKRGVRRRKSKR